MEKNLNLILLGPPGSGKSSTGNSILGRPFFSVSASPEVDKKYSFSKQTHQEVEFSITDGFDVVSCGENASFDHLVRDFQLNEKGLTAFLFVVKYGQKFIGEQCEVVEMTKNIFGKDVFKNFGICVLSCGDHYKYDNESQQSVNEWLDKQRGALRELYEECNKRCVLFDNRTNEDGEKKEQLRKLKEIVITIRQEKDNYGIYDFEEARPQRDRLTMQRELIREKPKFDKIIENLMSKASKAEEKKNRDELSSVKTKLEEHLDDIKARFDTDSVIAGEIKVKLENTIIEVKGKIKSLEASILLKQQNKDAARVSNNYDPMAIKTDTKRIGQLPNPAHDLVFNRLKPIKIIKDDITGHTSVFNQTQQVEHLEQQIDSLECVIMSMYENYLELADKKVNKSKYGEVEKKLAIFGNYKKQKLGDIQHSKGACSYNYY